MNNPDLTAEDMFQSLTGYDEIAIQQQFGTDLSELRKRPFMFLRTLVFVDLRRHDKRDPDAKEAALALTMAQLTDYFAEDDALDEDTDMGKDEPQPSAQPD